MIRSSILAAALACATPCAADVVIRGDVSRISDADTFKLGPVPIRLHGLDAVEAGQRCTRDGAPWDCAGDSTRALEALLQAGKAECVVVDVDRYRRPVATCWALDAAGQREGASVNERLVRAGWAIAFRRYCDTYVQAEAEARAAHRGLWSGDFEDPAQWRAARKGGALMSEHESMAQRAYEASRQQQQGRTDAAPAWAELPKGAREAIVSAVIFGWGKGHGEGVELGQRQQRR